MEEKLHEVNLDEVITKNYSNFKNGDFSMLTDDETNAFLGFIKSFILMDKYKKYFKPNELDDIMYEVFNRVMKTRLNNLNLKDFNNKPSTYLGCIVDSKIKHVISERSRLKRKMNYINLVRLDYPTKNEIDRDKPCSETVPSKEPSPSEHYLTQKEKNLQDLIISECENNELLNMSLIQKLSQEEIAKKYGVSRQAISLRLDNELGFAKINLAEKGIFDEVKVNKKDLNEYGYFKDRLQKYGLTYLMLNEEISASKIAKYLNVSEYVVQLKTNNNLREVKKALKQNGINILYNKSLKLFYEVFKDNAKNICDVPKENFAYVFDLIKKTPILNSYYLNSSKNICYLKKNNLNKSQVDELVTVTTNKIKQKYNNYLVQKNNSQKKTL